MNQIARFDLHPEKLDRTVEILQVRVSMRDLYARCEKVKSEAFHFVEVANGAVRNNTLATEGPVHS